MYALCDCNSFYASCERLFRPDLHGKPVVVLSNNDGCLIALTPEAKALGFKMGMVYFKVKKDLERLGVFVFSSNYPLYADLSNRVKTILDGMFPVQEIYSIDESFGTHIPDSWQCEPYGREIKNRVEQHTGIPVAVGFGATRTLAKLANRWAKKTQWFEGVVSWSELTPHQAQMLLKKTPADDVWGIGYRIARRLEEVGVKTAWDFMQVQPRDIRGVFNVTLAKTHRELWGESCLRVEDIENQTPKQIVSSRSFGARVESKLLLQQSLSQYVSRAAEKLRKHQLKAQQLSVWIRTSPFDQSQPYYAPVQTYSLAIPSDDSREFAAIARKLLDRIYKPGKEYHKAGVMLGELVDAHRVQPDLFASRPESTLMDTLDQINQRYGKRKMVLGSNLRDQQWKMRQNMRSPSYTTQWKELASVR